MGGISFEAFSGAEDMAVSFVNLDAMIPREDMLMPASEFKGKPPEQVNVTDLDTGFLGAMLRKPDFQRETTHWSPEKVAELIKAFMSGDLIPAVILWRRGTNIFVIDGAHRLSALMAWIKDDYGAGTTSQKHFQGFVTDEQQKIADRTRKVVNEAVGPYAQIVGARLNPKGATPELQEKLGILAANSIVAQWVPQVDEFAAEKSFFKINQAATPIDATESQVLQSRYEANAIASRAIVRGGAGHKYWASFEDHIKTSIEKIAGSIYSALYAPPLGQPIKTLDVPIAGRGYSALPFVYELVNWANDVSEKKKNLGQPQNRDNDGQETLRFLRKVERNITLLTGTEMRSLGLHPIVYFYTRGGEFQPIPFIAVCAFLRRLEAEDKLIVFSSLRDEFEKFLLANKDFVTLIVKRTGGKTKSLGRMMRYFYKVFDSIYHAKTGAEILDALNKDAEFAFLSASAFHLKDEDNDSNVSRRLSRATKSASFIDAAIGGVAKCGICGGLLHKNSIQIDHIVAAADGGATNSSNAQPTHPFCNSAKQQILAEKDRRLLWT